MAKGNGNPSRKLWYAVGVILLAAFIGFTTHQIYVESPKSYATKAEVKEIKTDLKDEIKEIKGDVKELLRRVK